MKTIWVISEGSPGHICQSEDLADALSDETECRVVIVRGRENIRGWLRSSVRFTMKICGGNVSDSFLSKVADIEIPEDAGDPDLLICSGGKSVFAAKALSVKHDTPLVFIGERKHFPAEWFHTVVSPVPEENAEKIIDVEMIPTAVSPALIAEHGMPEKGLWCMIVGGASRSHHFRKSDWKALARGMNVLAEREKIRWLLTTSRRTGTEAEMTLKETLNEEILEDAIWWSEKPRRELYDFMARSELLCVTQDSVTMVTEAVSSGRPVVSIYPDEVIFASDSFLPAYFDRLEKNRRMMRMSAAGLKDAEIDVLGFNLLAEEILHSVARELIKRLEWH
ncbi:MAG: ELM1/GtrOC1 family putative glycosyltransferase [Kiritimatiellia bacterium]